VTEYAPEPCPQCQAPVVWALDMGSVRQVPVDHAVSEDGSVALSTDWDGTVKARTISSVAARFGRKLRTSHLQTCPKKAVLRKKL
jgi:hypothetical protein